MPIGVPALASETRTSSGPFELHNFSARATVADAVSKESWNDFCSENLKHGHFSY